MIKNYKKLIKFLKNKYSSLLDKELRLPSYKILIDKNIFYKITKFKIKPLYKTFKERLNSFEAINKEILLKSDFNFISIYFLGNFLMISNVIEAKNNIYIKKTFNLKIPGDIVDDDKVLNFEALIKILEDIISVIGSKEIPILLNLSSKFFVSKTFSKKELSLLKNKNLKIISSSPFIEENTTFRLKEQSKINALEFTKIVYSRKDIIQSWVKVLSKLENPKIGISNGYLELVESIFKIDSKTNSYIIADVGAFNTTLFIKNINSEISTSILPFGSDLYNSESDEIRIQYFNRLKNTTDNLIEENGLSSKIKIYICGSGLYSIKKSDQVLPHKFIDMDFLFCDNIQYEKNDSLDVLSNTHFHNQSLVLVRNRKNLSFNFLDNYSNIRRWDPDKVENRDGYYSSKFSRFSKNFKKSILKIKNQKVLLYPTGSVLLLTLILWLTTLPSLITILRLKNNHLKYRSNINELRLTKLLIDEKIDNVISLSSIYKSQSPAYMFANFLQEAIPEDVKISNYLLNNSGFRIEFITQNIDNINKLIKLLSTIPLIEDNSLSIQYIREIKYGKGIGNSQAILELNGKIRNLTLEERLEYHLKFENFGKYSKLNNFSDIENIFGDK